MKLSSVTILAALTLLPNANAHAGNPFLDAPDDKPIAVQFRGIEWGDNIPKGEIPFSAEVVTTRVAKLAWGAIFKMEFTDIKSRAPEPRTITPEYFIVTNDRIVLLNEEDNADAIAKLSAMDKAPPFEASDIYGITSGKFAHEEGPWTTTIELKGNRCTYSTTHNSGHFKKVVWQKGTGLVEYAMGYGASADGFRLKRTQ